MQAQLPGANPETMASAVATPLEKQFSTIAGIDIDDSVSTSGQTHDPLCSSRSTATSTARAQDVQSAIAAAARSLPATLPTPPTQRKVNPADFLGPAPGARPRRRSRCRSWTTTARTFSPSAISTINGVAQVQVYGSQQYAVRIQLDPERSSRSRGIALTDVEQAIGDANVNLPDGHALRPRAARSTVQASGQLVRRAGLCADHRGLPQRRAGAPVAARTRVRQRRRTTRSRRGTTARAASCSPCSASRAPTRSRSSIAVKQILPTFQTAASAVRSSSSILYDRSAVDPRVGARRQVHACSRRSRSWSRVIFVFLRSAAGDVHPEPGAAAVDHRHLRGDVRLSATASTTCR